VSHRNDRTLAVSALARVEGEGEDTHTSTRIPAVGNLIRAPGQASAGLAIGPGLAIQERGPACPRAGRPRGGRARPLPGAAWRRAGNRHYRGRRAPGSGRAALARLPSGERIRLTVIEYDVPDVPDRQVQLADGFVDLPGSRMAAHQPQCGFQREPGGEQPVHHEVVHARGDAVAICTRSRAASAQSPAFPGGGSRVGRMLASFSSGIAP
jgi:hypothetical protein